MSLKPLTGKDKNTLNKAVAKIRGNKLKKLVKMAKPDLGWVKMSEALLKKGKDQ